MKRTAIWAIGIAAVIGAIVLLVLVNMRPSPDSVTIGVVLPLSGDAATYGESLQDGADLALEEINAANGGDLGSLRLVFEDSKASPKDAVSALNKLITVDRANVVIGGMFSHTTLAMAPIAQRNKVVLLSPTASAMAVPATGDYIFSIYPSDAQDGRFLAQQLADRTPADTTVAVVYSQVEAMETCKTAFIALAREQDHFQVVIEEGIPQGVQDLTAVVARVAAKKPDWILLATFLPETATFLRKAQQQDVQAQMLGISTCYDPKLFELAGTAADRLLFSAPSFDVDSSSSGVQAFIAAFEAKYGRKPDVWAAYGYDAIKIIADSLNRCDGDLAFLRETLAALKDYDGVTGTTSFNPDGSADKSLRLLQADAEAKTFRPAR